MARYRTTASCAWRTGAISSIRASTWVCRSMAWRPISVRSKPAARLLAAEASRVAALAPEAHLHVVARLWAEWGVLAAHLRTEAPARAARRVQAVPRWRGARTREEVRMAARWVP